MAVLVPVGSESKPCRRANRTCTSKRCLPFFGFPQNKLPNHTLGASRVYSHGSMIESHVTHPCDPSILSQDTSDTRVKQRSKKHQTLQRFAKRGSTLMFCFVFHRTEKAPQILRSHTSTTQQMVFPHTVHPSMSTVHVHLALAIAPLAPPTPRSFVSIGSRAPRNARPCGTGACTRRRCR